MALVIKGSVAIILSLFNVLTTKVLKLIKKLRFHDKDLIINFITITLFLE